MENKVQTIAPNSRFLLTVPQDEVPGRIDVFLAKNFSSYSRSFFQRLIDDNLISLNGKLVDKPSIVIKPTDAIAVQFPPQATFTPKESVPKDMGVTFVHEHPDFYIINKPPHLMVHAPSSYSTDITLVDWLATHCPEIMHNATNDRPGIVHRLDKGTSGLMIIARNPVSHNIFTDMFRLRTIKKTYIAVVKGHPDRSGVIDFPIARDPNIKTKMTHRTTAGRTATTNYRVIEYFDKTSLLELKPITGRTHQLRVHCAALGYAIIGDAQYGTESKRINRQALHAQSLAFSYQGTDYSFTQEPPEDFKKLVGTMKPTEKLPA